MPPTTSTTIDRTAEIAAIFEDLERRRLDAIQNQDEVAFRELYANDQYGELELESLSRVVVRDADAVLVSNFDVLAEVDGCIAFHAVVDLRLAIEGGSESEFVAVIERTDTGWGYSWIGSGWTCSGPHPLSS